MDVDSKMVCAIHQPNFFPWLGYFDKIVRADIFVLLDNVQLPKTGGGWINRVQILLGDSARWVSAPLNRAYHGTRLISEVTFSEHDPRWRENICKTLAAQYAKAKCFKETREWLFPVLMNGEKCLSEYNIMAIKEICRQLGVPQEKLVRGSDLSVTGSATDLLISILQALEADAYLCGGGAAGYQEDKKFEENAIDLIYQGFVHPQYKQFKNTGFQPGLSIIDALMHCGLAGVRELLKISD